MLHPSPQISGLTLVNLLPYTVQSSPYRNLILNSKSAPDGERGWLKVFAGISRGSKDEVRLLIPTVFSVQIAVTNAETPRRPRQKPR